MARYVSRPGDDNVPADPLVYVNAIQLLETNLDEVQAWCLRHKGTKAKPISYRFFDGGGRLQVVRWDDTDTARARDWLVDYGKSTVMVVSDEVFTRDFVEFIPEEKPDVA